MWNDIGDAPMLIPVCCTNILSLHVCGPQSDTYLLLRTLRQSQCFVPSCQFWLPVMAGSKILKPSVISIFDAPLRLI